MTEKEFNQKIENMASQLEQKIEIVAEHLDKGITQKYKQSRLFRFVARGTSMAAEISLLAGAKHLADRGKTTAAIWCAGLSAVGLAVDVLQIFLFRRKK